MHSTLKSVSIRYLSWSILLFLSPIYAASNKNVVRDERHITKSWPQELVDWVKKNEVPQALKKQIDSVLNNSTVLQLLSKIYMARYAEDSEAQQAKKTLTVTYGFTFLKDERNEKNNIFALKQVPGYVFKMALPHQHAFNRRTELYSASRIKYAHKILADAAKAGITNIVIPDKFLYIVPEQKNVPYSQIPKLLVVATWATTQPVKELTGSQTKTSEWLVTSGFFDNRADNVIPISGGKILIIDTEPRYDTTKYRSQQDPTKILSNTYFINNNKVIIDVDGIPLRERRQSKL